MSSTKPEDMSHSVNFSEEEKLLDGKDNQSDSHDLRLLRASKKGWDDIVKLLLDQSDNLDCGQYEIEGHTPLTFAARNGHEKVVRLLLEHGADVERRNDSIPRGPPGLKFLPHTPLAWAAGDGHAKVVRILLEAGADTNGGEFNGSLTPLATAAVRGHEETVAVLLEQADIEFERRCSTQSRTVLSHCAEDGQENIVAQLLAKGADPNLQDGVGRSPFLWAAENGHTTIVSTLLAHGADLNQVDQRHSALGHDSHGGRTALFYAANRGHGDVVQLLIQKGADPNQLDKGGWTSLGCAIFRGHVSAVQVLLEHGADADKGNIRGMPVRKYVKLNLACAGEPARPGFEEIHQLIQKFCPEEKPPGFFQGFLAMWK